MTILVTSAALKPSCSICCDSGAQCSRAGHLVVVGLVPAVVVQDQFLAALDDADVDRQVDRVDVVLRVGAALDEGAVGMEHAERAHP